MINRSNRCALTMFKFVRICLQLSQPGDSLDYGSSAGAWSDDKSYNAKENILQERVLGPERPCVASREMKSVWVA